VDRQLFRQLPQLIEKLVIQPFDTLHRGKMSFERVSERLKVLQESNVQLRDLIDRLANLKFQPGSIPLDEEEDNAKVELAAEIHQIIKDQEEDLTDLQEDVIDLDFGRSSRELEGEKAVLDQAVKKALEELKTWV
jgi:protein transport protein SEC20